MVPSCISGQWNTDLGHSPSPDDAHDNSLDYLDSVCEVSTTRTMPRISMLDSGFRRGVLTDGQLSQSLRTVVLPWLLSHALTDDDDVVSMMKRKRTDDDDYDGGSLLLLVLLAAVSVWSSCVCRVRLYLHEHCSCFFLSPARFFIDLGLERSVYSQSNGTCTCTDDDRRSSSSHALSFTNRQRRRRRLFDFFHHHHHHFFSWSSWRGKKGQFFTSSRSRCLNTNGLHHINALEKLSLRPQAELLTNEFGQSHFIESRSNHRRITSDLRNTTNATDKPSMPQVEFLNHGTLTSPELTTRAATQAI